MPRHLFINVAKYGKLMAYSDVDNDFAILQDSTVTGDTNNIIITRSEAEQLRGYLNTCLYETNFL